MPRLRRTPSTGSASRPRAIGPVAFVLSTAALLAVMAALAPAGDRLGSLATGLPVALAAVAAAAAVTARRPAPGRGAAALPWQAGLAGALAVFAVGAAWAFATASEGAAGVAAALAQLPTRAGAALLVLTGASAVVARSGAAPRAGHMRRVAGSLAAAALVGTLSAVPTQTASAAAIAPPTTPAACVEGQQQRQYAISATTVDLPFNRWGATLPSARVFVMDHDLAATKNWSRPLNADPNLDPAKNRRLRPRPLVLRANEGECVKVTLTNRLGTASGHGLPASPRVGIQAAGVIVSAEKSGAALKSSGTAKVGFGDDATVGNLESITYYWRVPAQEGLFLFQDMATPAGGEHDGGSRGVGLYGALAVEPKGSTWTDPRSGAVLSGGTPATYKAASTQSGELYVEADIHLPDGTSFRESVQLAQDEIGGIGMGFNYGSEPMANRESRACPDCLGEETWLSSWPYGDPALIKLASGPGPWLPTGNGTEANKEKEDCGLPESCYVSNVFHAYAGDATKIRFGLAGVKETHVFHLHAHQWLADARDDALTGEGPGSKPESTTIDSQSFGPGEAYTADLLYGAGSKNGTFGDSIFHCHLYPHFAEGFWALLRVHDVLLDGGDATPDGVNVRPLKVLPDATPLPAPTAENPGYPGMIPGTFGWRAPQPPGSITEGSPDGPTDEPAARLVAGREIAAEKLATETAVIARRNGGNAANAPAGAPFSNPCPSTARVVKYDVTVLQRDLVYNEAGHHDPQARFMVLTKDVPAILDGTKKAEPLFIRVNAGDCIDFSLTNMAPNWTGGDAFQQLTQTNMVGAHIHLVKFDVTASDGGSNGWNYQQAAFSQEQAALTAEQASGATTCTPGTQFFGGESTGCRVPDRTTWDVPQNSRGMWGQTIHERWYADYELRTVFTHDHHFAAQVQNHGQFGALIVEPQGYDVRDPQTGRFLQPINSSANGTPCGTSCTGDAVGEQVDVVGPGANDDYREYGIAIADFVPLVKKGGNPKVAGDVVQAPGAPEHFPSADPGTFAINYRNAPLSERRALNGQAVDPAHKFSSHVFGDPMTPLLQGYARDNVKLRVIQGSQEEQHLFQVHGLRWREEPDDPGSPLVSAQTIGISEAFNAELPGLDCSSTETPCRGDYLYGGTSMDDLWNGMWGLMRVHGKPQPGLPALPDNPVSGTPVPLPTERVVAPPRAVFPGTTCPATAPVKSFEVVAINKDLVYNEFGDHDPQGLMYVLAADEAAVRSGAKKAEPLVIRANAGDCVKVDLRNALPQTYAGNVNGVDGDPAMVLENVNGTPMGTRVSMHPQLVRHDVRLSDGAAIGFNPDSTVGIGQSIKYEWFADTELGATNLVDYGDVRGHRQHGLAGALVIEPKDATYHDPATGAQIASGAAADIRVPGEEDFREMTLVYQDGLNLRLPNGAQVPDKALPVDPADLADGAVLDAEVEDAGEKGVNYTSAPLHRRLGAAPGAVATATSQQWADVFSSSVLRDPATPIARAYEGDQVRMRVLGANRPRQMAFQLDGASWRSEPWDTQSDVVGVQGGIGSGKAVNASVRLGKAGDHLWSSPTSMNLPDGIWGLARVYPKPSDPATFAPTVRDAVDNPFAGKQPLQLLEPPAAPAPAPTPTPTTTTSPTPTTAPSDVTPPPAPTFSKTGAVTIADLITIATTEAGAKIRYTFDGTTPTATRGMVYDAPVRIGLSRTVKAVAVDAAGNASAVTSAAFTLPWKGAKVTGLKPSAWSVTSGGTPRGGVAETGLDDDKVLAVGSVPVTTSGVTKATVDITATVPIPSTHRSATTAGGSSVSASVKTTIRDVPVRVFWYDVSTSTWRLLHTVTPGLDEAKIDVDLGAASKMADASGNAKIKFTAQGGSTQGFDLLVDQVNLSAQNK